jgi:diguanylate cyclase (GGDEF)-like protein
VCRISDIEEVSKNVLKSFTKPFHYNNQNIFFITASVGFRYIRWTELTQEELMKNADLAMYKSKEEGRNRYSFFSSDMKRGSRRNHEDIL